MKTLALFICIILGVEAVGQTKSHSQMMWEFANDNIGKRVGKGHCYELIREGYKQFGDYRISKRIYIDSIETYYGRPIPKDSVAEGDIVLFRVFDKLTKKELTGHIGIVYAMSETNMSVANQNYHVSKAKDGVVEIIVLDDIIQSYSNLDCVVSFHRPY